jgi:hypothetical protein
MDKIIKSSLAISSVSIPGLNWQYINISANSRILIYNW